MIVDGHGKDRQLLSKVTGSDEAVLSRAPQPSFHQKIRTMTVFSFFHHQEAAATIGNNQGAVSRGYQQQKQQQGLLELRRRRLADQRRGERQEEIFEIFLSFAGDTSTPKVLGYST